MDISLSKDSKESNSKRLNTDKQNFLVNEFKTQLLLGTSQKATSNTVSFNTNTLNMIKELDSYSNINLHPHIFQQMKELQIRPSNENIIQAFIKTISKFIHEDDKEKTLQGLNVKIKEASECLFLSVSQERFSEGRSTITLKAISEIIIHMINKHISRNLSVDFNCIKSSIVSLCEDLYQICEASKAKISKFFRNAMRTGMTVLVHGYSSTVLQALVDCKKYGINLNVFVTECSPDHSGLNMKKALTENGIKSNVIIDLSVGYYMKDIDCIIVGSNALCENGGLINRTGTYTLAICAKSFKKPFYVLSECLKFLKLYPLEQGDIPFNNRYITNDLLLDKKNTGSLQPLQQIHDRDVEADENGINYSLCDYTPPEFINLLFTDIGIFTPSALSDELIQMFYN